MPRRAAAGSVARKLGRRIRALREEKGLTQEGLAWDSDLAKAHLSLIESGQRLPSIAVICVLAKQLDVHPADILAYDAKDRRLSLLDAARRRDREAVEVVLRDLGLK